ncbi:MAG TPA: hypothetical protein VFI25_19920 [Planctomycetota bacterium]|jgi:hypothetical protein|nr:hypothetical protein [Planctomycetota bacterium]
MEGTRLGSMPGRWWRGGACPSGNTDGIVDVLGRGEGNIVVGGCLRPGGQARITIEAPREGGRRCLLLFSGGDEPPACDGPFLIPAAADPLLANSFAMDLGGTLDPAGHGSVVISIPAHERLAERRICASAIVLDPDGALGIGTSLPGVKVTAF